MATQDTLITMLNLIRQEASDSYQDRVPTATAENLASVGYPIMEYTATMNEFLNALVNRIGLTLVRNKIANNPLAILKRGGIPLGKDVQEIFTNMAKAKAYDQTGANLLATETPDTKALYHRLNRQDMYKVTIRRPQLQFAFTDFGKLEELVNSVVSSLYSGDSYDEFMLMKELFSSAITNNKIVNFSVDDPLIEANAKSFVKAVKTISGNMAFPSASFNKYIDFAPVADTKPVITWTEKENQILLMRSDILASIDVDVLASAFNLGKVEFMGRVVEVDNFGSAVDTCAILCDEAYPFIMDNHQEMTEFYNPEGLYWNYMWHHWQTYSLSLFANAVAFSTTRPEEPPVG